MSKLWETHYENCQNANDDPTWKKNGLHQGNSQGVTLIQDPLGQHGKVIKFLCQGGGKDTVWGTTNADRAEVMNERQYHQGDQIVIAASFLLKEYRSNESQWNLMSWEMHDGLPGPTQSPVGTGVNNNVGLNTRLWGGPPNSGNGMTGTERQNLQGFTWPDINRWVPMVWRVYLHPDKTQGLFTLWLDGKIVWDVKAATIVTGHPGYIKHGMYRGTTGLRSSYCATNSAAFTTVQEAFDYLKLAQPAPGPGPTPTPDPTPTPTGTITRKSNIQSGATVAPGDEWYVDTAVPVKSITFTVNNQPPIKVEGPGVKLSTHIPDNTPEGPGSLTFMGLKIDGSPAFNVGPFPVTFKKKVTLLTNRQLVDKAWAEFGKTTEPYSVWNKRTSAKKVGTKWQAGKDYLDKVTDK